MIEIKLWYIAVSILVLTTIIIGEISYKKINDWVIKNKYNYKPLFLLGILIILVLSSWSIILFELFKLFKHIRIVL